MTGDLYRIPAGPDLDQLIHTRLFGETIPDRYPAYSTDEECAMDAFRALRKRHDSSAVIGKTRISGRRHYFARYGSDPSTSTEVLAESKPLAICRLILLRLRHKD